VPYVDSNDTTNLLIDFTQQFEAISSTSQMQPSTHSPSRRVSKGGQLLNYLQSQRSPVKHSVPAATPKKNILNLLDFELPPAPTPRSVPTITIRELESLKSSYATEISNLKATLSGREAEVEALKRSVADAERRVGETAESLREERDKCECIQKEKEEWERRGREFEEILKKVKEEVLVGERERSELEERVRDAEHRAEEAERRAVEAATKVVLAPAEADREENNASEPLFTAEQVQKQIDEKVHALSTELHAIYKKKHVSKVAGLKKGFEAKTKEKTAELQSRIDELEKRNDDLQAKVDGTLSGKVVLSGLSGASSEDKEKMKEQAALIERQKAELTGKEEELKTVQQEFTALIKELERERVEKGELVAAVDEMLALQSDMSTMTPASANNAVEDFKKSIGMGVSRPSGLRGPGFGFQGQATTQQSKIGTPAGLHRSTSGGKSRMMSNIERMGSRAVD
jgi:myosin heavy subunit